MCLKPPMGSIVAQVFSVEMILDDESFAVVWGDARGSRKWLFYPEARMPVI